MSVKLVPELVPLSETAKESDALVQAAVDRNRNSTNDAITAACELARVSRSSSASSAKRLKAVRPDRPLPNGDVTERFEAIRANVR